MMECPICRTKEPKWENVDKFRIKPEGMSICMECGFVSYPDLYKTKDEIIKYYEKEYRSSPQTGNLYSGQRKLHYHMAFLEKTLKKWQAEKRKDLVVSDVGAAFGMFLNWIKSFFPEADINGVELTQSFVRNAWHLYNIKLEKDFDGGKKYDLISSYKSIEHIMDPDVELTRYISALKDDGILYLSSPIWFRTLCNFGTRGWDIEYYYHTNHINVWNKDQLEALIKVCGGEIIKENNTLYESTYLIKRNDSFKTDDRSSLKQDPKKIMTNMQRIFAANEAYETTHYSDAIKIWPNFPYAHVARYEHNRKKYNDLGFDAIYNGIIKEALESCPDEADMQYLAADICMRYNKYDEAIKHLKTCQEMRPNTPGVFTALSNAFRTLGERSIEEKDKIKFFIESREASQILKDVSLQNFVDATNWIMFDNSKIPTPFEE